VIAAPVRIASPEPISAAIASTILQIEIKAPAAAKTTLTTFSTIEQKLDVKPPQQPTGFVQTNIVRAGDIPNTQILNPPILLVDKTSSIAIPAQSPSRIINQPIAILTNTSLPPLSTPITSPIQTAPAIPIPAQTTAQPAKELNTAPAQPPKLVTTVTSAEKTVAANNAPSDIGVMPQEKSNVIPIDPTKRPRIVDRIQPLRDQMADHNKLHDKPLPKPTSPPCWDRIKDESNNKENPVKLYKDAMVGACAPIKPKVSLANELGKLNELRRLDAMRKTKQAQASRLTA
jgi:hypothetical protein